MPKKSPKTPEITQPPELHDTFFRQLFSDPKAAAEFIEQYLPAQLVALLDLSQLKAEKDTFVDARLRKHFSDILFSVTLRSGGKITIYLLFEHKSHPDKGVRLQLLRYMVRIWEKEWKKKKQLSPIVPIVFYHGVEAWTYTKQFADLLEMPNELKQFTPQFQHLLIDLSAYTDEQIRNEVWWQVGLLVMKHIFDDDLGQQLPRLMLLMRDLTRQESGMEMLQTVLLYIAETNKVTRKEFERGFAAARLPGGTELMETFAQRYRNEGRQQAIETLTEQWKEEVRKEALDTLAPVWKEEGRKEALDTLAPVWKEEGRKEALDTLVPNWREEERQQSQRQTLLRLLQKRFHPSEKQVSNYLQQVEQIADLQALATLIDALLDVQTLAQFDTILFTYLPKPDEKTQIKVMAQA